jgi:hypothetical protein
MSEWLPHHATRITKYLSRCGQALKTFNRDKAIDIGKQRFQFRSQLR